MVRRHSRVAGWFNRVFPGFVGPDLIDEIVVPMVSYYGTEKLQSMTFIEREGTAASSINSLTVPPGKIWFVPYCSGHHDDTGVSHVATIGVRLTGDSGSIISLVGDKALAVINDKVAVGRAFYVPPLARINFSTSAATAAGKKLFLRFCFAEIPLGETVEWPG